MPWHVPPALCPQRNALPARNDDSVDKNLTVVVEQRQGLPSLPELLGVACYLCVLLLSCGPEKVFIVSKIIS